MKKHVIIFWVSVFMFFTGFGQSGGTDTRDIVKRITLINKFESEYVGFAGSASKQYKNYKRLLETATEKELQALLSHKNAAVRVYVFMALQKKNPTLAKKASKKLLNDKEIIRTLQGCIGGVTTVRELVATIVLNQD
ncbi:MAG TPA: hypothetical protein VL098_02845 [Flavipsychrobacter sp.]|nr:hypothetical protein [Flavipsychrobacter sp.]